MMNVILVAHLLIALAIIALVLLQRSEGGGILGGGGSGGLGGFATPQATANALTKATWICITCFFTTSLVLGIMAAQVTSKKSIIERLDAPVAAQTETKPSEPSVPISE